jgi:anthraniloyl-CoA monooxygenase
MKIVSIGGGPAGLYFAILMKKQDPAHDITVVERNRPYDTFGWGVVFSDETLGGFEVADKETYDRITAEFAYWPDIDTYIHGECIRSTGHGFAGMSRKRLLNIFQERCEELGVRPRRRPGPRRGRRAFVGARALQRQVQAQYRLAQMQILLARR